MPKNDFFWVFAFFSSVLVALLYIFDRNLGPIVQDILEYLPWLNSVPSVEGIFEHSRKSDAYFFGYILLHILAPILGLYMVLIRRSDDVLINTEGLEASFLKVLCASLALFPAFYLFFFYQGISVSDPDSKIVFTRIRVSALQSDVYFLLLVSLISTTNTYCSAAVVKIILTRRKNHE